MNTINRKNLLEMVVKSKKNLSKNNPVVILDYIEIEIKDSKGFIKSNSFEIQYCIAFETLHKDLHIFVNPDYLEKTLKALKSEEIYFEKNVLFHDKGSIKLNSIEGEDVPVFNYGQSLGAFCVNSSDLIQASRFVGKDHFRPVLQNININQQNICATDATKLIILKNSIQTEVDSFDITVPTELVKILCKDSEYKGTLYIHHTSFICENETIFVRNIDGTFPNYMQVIPTANQFSLQCQKNELVDAINTCLLSGNQTNKIVFEGNIVRSENIDLATESIYNIDAVNNGVHVAVNGKELLSILKEVEIDSVLLETNGVGKPMTIVSDNKLLLLMTLSIL